MAYSQSAAAILTGKWTYRSFLNDPTLVTSDPGRVIAVHTALKGVSDPLKAEFVGSLNLELPAASQGDND